VQRRMWKIDVVMDIAWKVRQERSSFTASDPRALRALDTAWIGAATSTYHQHVSTRWRASSARRAGATPACQCITNGTMTGGRSSNPATTNARRGEGVWKRWFAGRGVLNGDLRSKLQVPGCDGAVSGWHGR
jgi:hypothetical protein